MDSEFLNEEVKIHMLSATALRVSKSLLYVGETMLNKILVISGYFYVLQNRPGGQLEENLHQPRLLLAVTLSPFLPGLDPPAFWPPLSG